MGDTDRENTAVNAKAVLIDAKTMTVLWMNESALQDCPEHLRQSRAHTPVSLAFPLSVALGIEEALRSVSDTGIPRHLASDLVSTSKGSMTIASSIYRLPNGNLLLLMEKTWQFKKRKRT